MSHGIPDYTIVLAAGKGSRMGSESTPKVCFEINGVPAINRALEIYSKCGIPQHVVVVGTLAGKVVETVGGMAPTMDMACAIVRPRGTVIPLGLWDEPVKIDSWNAVFKEITFTFALAYGQVGLRTDYEFAIELMATRKVPLQDLITHQVPLANIREAFELADDKSRGAIKVVVRP